MKYLSLFSGIEAATVAWEPLGWDPVAYSEIDPFPSAVLAYRFPEVPNLGDVTQVDWSEYRGAVNLIVGGSPCQSFSMGGRREGLAGESGLMFEYIRAVREVLPRYFIWENVFGALSSEGGEAFRQLLSEMDALGYGLAWRILDAQFFGVPQRRERVFLVGVLGDPERAAEILFEQESLRWDCASSRDKRKALIAKAERGPSGCYTLKVRCGCAGGGKGALVQDDLSATLTHHNDQTLFAPQEDGTLLPRNLTPLEWERLQGFPSVVKLEVEKMTSDELISCALANGDIFCDFETGEIYGTRGPGGKKLEEPRRLGFEHPSGYIHVNLSANGQKKQVRAHRIVYIAGYGGIPEGYTIDHINNEKADNRLCNLQALLPEDNSHKACADGLYLSGEENPAAKISAEVRAEILHEYARGNCTYRDLAARHGISKSRVGQIIQEDDWTRIPFQGKPAEECRDTLRYRAVGNSMAVPVMRWLGERIDRAEKRIGGEAMEVPRMPDQYRGRTTKSGGYTASAPREWTQEEIDWCLRLQAQGYSGRQIAESVGRTETSVKIKLKRLTKKDGTYNAEHVQDKYAVNRSFIADVRPASLLDCYAGKRTFYAETPEVDVTDNDANPEADTEYHLDALKLLCTMYAEGCRFDVVDLDPFGSAYDCFDLAVKMARKGLCITFGELGHKRWKRLDFVSRYYGIESLEGFTLDALIRHVQMIGRRNKKVLKVYAAREWRNIGRVWFTIEEMKITEQWAGKTAPEPTDCEAKEEADV